MIEGYVEKLNSNLACLQDIYLVVGYVYNSILYVSIPIAGIKSYDIEVINILSITSHNILNSIIETTKGTNVCSIIANVSLADGAQFVQIVFKVTID